MNPVQTQMELQRELGSLSVKTFQRIAELNQASFARYGDMNKEFAAKRPQLGDISGWTQLQREYGETMWAAAQENMKQQGEVWKEAFEQSTDLIRSAFNPSAAAKAE